MFWCFSTTMKDPLTCLACFPAIPPGMSRSGTVLHCTRQPHFLAPAPGNFATERHPGHCSELGQLHMAGGRAAAGGDLQLWDLQTAPAAPKTPPAAPKTPPAAPTCLGQICSLSLPVQAVLRCSPGRHLSSWGSFKKQPLCSGGHKILPKLLTSL